MCNCIGRLHLHIPFGGFAYILASCGPCVNTKLMHMHIFFHLQPLKSGGFSSSFRFTGLQKPKMHKLHIFRFDICIIICYNISEIPRRIHP